MPIMYSADDSFGAPARLVLIVDNVFHLMLTFVIFCKTDNADFVLVATLENRLCSCYKVLERCNPWPHVANRHISISQLLSL